MASAVKCNKYAPLPVYLYVTYSRDMRVPLWATLHTKNAEEGAIGYTTVVYGYVHVELYTFQDAQWIRFITPKDKRFNWKSSRFESFKDSLQILEDYFNLRYDHKKQEFVRME
tara:strand:+ start:101 stop:439 length:339 start_codon:yes stop_codon:yes gene_type:complete